MIFSITDEDLGEKMSQSQFGKMLKPPMVWNTASTQIAWQFKHSLNGIQPSRAIVVMLCDVTIPSGKVFILK